MGRYHRTAGLIVLGGSASVALLLLLAVRYGVTVSSVVSVVCATGLVMFCARCIVALERESSHAGDRPPPSH